MVTHNFKSLAEKVAVCKTTYNIPWSVGCALKALGAISNFHNINCRQIEWFTGVVFCHGSEAFGESRKMWLNGFDIFHFSTPCLLVLYLVALAKSLMGWYFFMPLFPSEHIWLFPSLSALNWINPDRRGRDVGWTEGIRQVDS